MNYKMGNDKIIYFLTRSFYPFQSGGGPLARTGTVNSLRKKGWRVVVVMPNYKSHKWLIEKDIYLIPFSKSKYIKLFSLLERIGIFEDYLDKWVEIAFEYLKKVIKKDSIILSTSGGELGMIKLGSKLKKYSAKNSFVIHYHDPLNYGYMSGLKRDRKFHVSRQKYQEKYMSNADSIITTSEFYSDILIEKFISLRLKIKNVHLGYIKEFKSKKYQKKSKSKLRIAYSGIMSSVQKPEQLYEAFLKLGPQKENVEIFFIGNRKNYRPLKNIKHKNVYFYDFIPHNDYLSFMYENIDIGFVSLTSSYYGACVPSKIYEYINLELPIIGVLPEGDAKKIIEKNKFGLASNYGNINNISENIKALLDEEIFSLTKQNIIQNRRNFSIEKSVSLINEIIIESMNI